MVPPVVSCPQPRRRLGSEEYKGMDAATVIQSIRQRGVHLWVENTQLRYRGPAEAIDAETLATLRKFKEPIIARLSRPTLVTNWGSRITPRSADDVIPLTPSQQHFWNSVESLSLPFSRRSMVFAERIRGSLNIELLRLSILHVIQRDESLRTTVVLSNGVPIQKVLPVFNYELDMVNLAHVPREEIETTARCAVDEFIATPIRLVSDNLFAFRLFVLGKDDYVAVTAIDHFIADRLSLFILRRDIGSVYAQLSKGLAPSLPPSPVQFADYAVWLKQQVWTGRHEDYWRTRIDDACRVRLPRDEGLPRADRPKYEQVPVTFGKTLTARLHDLAKSSGITLVTSVLAAYVAVTLHWVRANDLTVWFIISGRDSPEVENAIGFFAHALLLRVQLRELDTFLSLLRRVNSELYSARKFDDFSRLLLRKPACAFNTGFNWLIDDQSTSSLTHQEARGPQSTSDGIEAAPFPFTVPEFDIAWGDNPEWHDSEPGVHLAHGPEGISGTLFYHSHLFNRSTMERFVRDFRLFATALADAPLARVSSVRTAVPVG